MFYTIFNLTDAKIDHFKFEEQTLIDIFILLPPYILMNL